MRKKQIDNIPAHLRNLCNFCRTYEIPTPNLIPVQFGNDLLLACQPCHTSGRHINPDRIHYGPTHPAIMAQRP